MLVKHVRDVNRKPFATIVAISADKFGVAICSEHDKFNKKLGTKIAKTRALSGTPLPTYGVPNRNVETYLSTKLPMDAMLIREVNTMLNRAKRYFKEGVQV